MIRSILLRTQANRLRTVWGIIVAICLCANVQICYGQMSSTSTFYTVSNLPLAAREISGGMTSDESEAILAPRRVIILDDDDDDGYGDDPLRPGYDPQDPGAPVGDIPWPFLLALCILCTLRIAFRPSAEL